MPGNERKTEYSEKSLRVRTGWRARNGAGETEKEGRSVWGTAEESPAGTVIFCLCIYPRKLDHLLTVYQMNMAAHERPSPGRLNQIFQSDLVYKSTPAHRSIDRM